jgi:hypothetical protein
MNPVDHPEAYETITLAGVVSPGVCTIAGLNYEMGWDVQDADGENGASLARKGRKLSKFTVRFHLVRDLSEDIDQFAEWYEEFLPLLKSCFVGKEPVGLVITHPEAQALEVDSVVVERIGQIDRDPEDYGSGTVDVSLIQYAPAKKVSTKGPSNSKNNGKGGAEAGGTDPNDPIQQRIDTLNELLEGP